MSLSDVPPDGNASQRFARLAALRDEPGDGPQFWQEARQLSQADDLLAGLDGPPPPPPTLPRERAPDPAEEERRRLVNAVAEQLAAALAAPQRTPAPGGKGVADAQ